jgi:hypothetical protein
MGDFMDEDKQEIFEKGRKQKYQEVYKKRRRVFGHRKYEGPAAK